MDVALTDEPINFSIRFAEGVGDDVDCREKSTYVDQSSNEIPTDHVRTYCTEGQIGVD